MFGLWPVAKRSIWHEGTVLSYNDISKGSGFTLMTLSWHRWMVLQRSSVPWDSRLWWRICSKVYTASSICCGHTWRERDANVSHFRDHVFKSNTFGNIWIWTKWLMDCEKEHLVKYTHSFKIHYVNVHLSEPPLDGVHFSTASAQVKPRPPKLHIVDCAKHDGNRNTQGD